MKERIDKLEFIKIEHFCSVKIMSRTKKKKKTQSRRKILAKVISCC